MRRLKEIERLTMDLYRLHEDTDKIYQDWCDQEKPSLTYEEEQNLFYYLVAMSVAVSDLEIEVTKQQTRWWRFFHRK